MNHANMTSLAAYLRAPEQEHHFDLNTYFTDGQGYSLRIQQTPLRKRINRCGAVACIAGHAVILSDPDAVINSYIHERAAQWLGITGEQADVLFTPSGNLVDYDAVTAEIAAQVVEHLRDTGEVRWPAEVQPVDA